MSLYRKKLDKIFFGNPPNHLTDVPENLLTEAFARQGVMYAFGEPLSSEILNVNYVTFIQDIMDIDKERIKPNDLPLSEIQRLSGIFTRSEFYEWIQDKTKDIWQKFYKCFYNRNFILALKMVYNIDSIDDQEGFLADVQLLENYYYNAIMLQAEQNASSLKEKKSVEIRFKEILSEEQQKQIQEFLNERCYTDNSRQFVEYLTGKNDGKGFHILPGKEDEVCYFLYLLYQAKLIQLTSGKAYQQYIEMTLYPFSQEKEKCQIKYRVRKIQRTKSSNPSILKELNAFLRSIIV